MMAGDLPWRADRNAAFIRQVELRGFDLTGRDQRMQVRVSPGAPGTPLISLAPAAAGSQGLSVSYDPAASRTVDGQAVTMPISTITIRIDLATLQALVPAGAYDPGDVVLLHYDHLIALPGLALQPLLQGAFTISPGVTVP